VEKVRVLYDVLGRTLTVWIGDPQTEVVCEETEGDVILMKDGEGVIIGFEKLNVSRPDTLGVTVEVLPAS
jgi:hypothetical protein